MFGIIPAGLVGRDGGNPVGETFRRWDFSGHAGVDVGVGRVDKYRQQNDFANVGPGLAGAG